MTSDEEMPEVTKIEYDQKVVLTGKPTIYVILLPTGQQIICEMVDVMDGQDQEYPTMVVRYPFFFWIESDESGEEHIRFSLLTNNSKNGYVCFHLNSMMATFEPKEAIENAYIYTIKRMGLSFSVESGLMTKTDEESQEEYESRIKFLVEFEEYDSEFPN